MSDFVITLKRERDQLRRKLERIDQLLSDYEPQSPLVAAPSVATNGSQTDGGIFLSSAPKTKRSRVRAVITTMLEQKGSVHRKEVLDQLKAQGIMGSEKDPMQALAIYFSEFKEFRGDGNGNWTKA